MIEIKHKNTGEVLRIVQADTLVRANLFDVDLSYADLSNANLSAANLFGTSLYKADLTNANLTGADLSHADLRGASLDGAQTFYTRFLFCDNLYQANGLKSVIHLGPSSLDTTTLRANIEHLPDAFLLGVGYRSAEIDNLRDFYAINKNQFDQSVENDNNKKYASCFISYSHKDEEFVSHLHSRFVKANILIYYARKNMKSGQKIREQIKKAIRIHDRLLLVLSEESMRSEWVTTELREAHIVEIQEKKRKLFPISITDWQKIADWECFDTDIGKNLAVEIREYFVPDFSNWRDHNAFEAAFQELLESLQSEDALN